MKLLAGLGECGSILTNDEQMISKIKVLRYNGTVNRQTCIVPSLNSRLDSLQAAILSARIEFAYREIDLRRKNAAIYESLIADYVTTPSTSDTRNHVFYAYTIQTEFRDQLQNHLAEFGIETKIMHPLPMPLHPAYIGSQGEWSNAQLLTSRILSLPIASHLSESDIESISGHIIDFFTKERKS